MKRDFDILYENPFFSTDNHGFPYRFELYRDKEQQVYIDDSCAPINGMPHFHNALEILYAERGIMRVRLDDVEHELHAGQFIAVSSFAMHDCRTDSDSVRWVMLIPTGVLGSAAKLMDGKAFDRCICNDDGTMFELMKIGKQITECTGVFAGQRGTAHQQQAVSALVTTALTIAIAACGLRERSFPMPLVVETLEYLHLHFREEIRVPDIAKKLLCSQKTMSDAFGEVFGITIKTYVNHLRAIDVHYNLSQNPQLTLEEASERSGFGSLRSMLRAYRQEYGCTPREHTK